MPSSELPGGILETYQAIMRRYDPSKNWSNLTEEELWHELCFCILSSNVHYETAYSALLQLRTKRLIETSGCSLKLIATELRRPIYLPRRKDGSFRRYRFSRRRACDIVRARRYVYQMIGGVRKLLERTDNAYEMRDFLAGNVPGLGLKEASHFLRNVKFSDSLAIIDSHVAHYIKTSFPEVQNVDHFAHRTYLEFERLMQNVAASHNMSLAVLDMAIWEWMRR
jgi:N-glycosylase/DNA lyase